MASKLTRVAIVSDDKCKPKKCRQECKKSCPVVRTGKLCIEVTPDSRLAFISETLCIGCGICPKKCPFGAITIINLPTNLESQVTHRYSANSFKVHRLPTPRPGQVLGLVGTNGIGKNYFTKLLEDDLKAVVKPQYVDQLPRAVKTPDKSVRYLLERGSAKGNMDEVLDTLELRHLLDRDVNLLSGGELQRFAIGTVCVQNADVYMFDEPSSYLDVKQRLSAGRMIRSLLDVKNYVIVVEHDLSVLDYLSDYICVLYGQPAVYGVVTLPYSVREGINIFLDGHIPTENLRFRDESLTFRISEGTDDFQADKARGFTYPKMEKTLGNFRLRIDAGNFTDSEILVMMGENGTGKTSFCRLLAGALKPDSAKKVPDMRVSLKPQTITPKFEGFLVAPVPDRCSQAFETRRLHRPGKQFPLPDNRITQAHSLTSLGELQRVAIVMALGLPADIYLIDEPSAYLDSEQRIIAARVIKRFIMSVKKTAFIVEHDFLMATYLADRVIVFDGKPGIDAHANAPESLLTGCNKFLKNLDVTFRRDPTNYRPRINKLNSQLDQEQKLSGNYDSSSSRKIAHEEGIPKHHDHRDDRKNRHHRRIPQASIHGVLGVQKRNGKRQNGSGTHELSGLEDDSGEDGEEPDDSV
ncbi:hypothetical protein O1611_g3669 [Lasiodiplodia mahajangana]|uniref:Uncharacterized protein n=1 Tax=Lasiodiplodia mahajangana TaxID=1108764 RepID=A0ACC2JRB0_9PEZI|nr:hypothetical protein O1611_g3669 [Lasiodiplodia mahajangana]